MSSRKVSAQSVSRMRLQRGSRRLIWWCQWWFVKRTRKECLKLFSESENSSVLRKVSARSVSWMRPLPGSRWLIWRWWFVKSTRKECLKHHKFAKSRFRFFRKLEISQKKAAGYPRNDCWTGFGACYEFPCQDGQEIPSGDVRYHQQIRGYPKWCLTP